MAYLHLTSAHSKDHDQGHAYFYSELKTMTAMEEYYYCHKIRRHLPAFD